MYGLKQGKDSSNAHRHLAASFSVGSHPLKFGRTAGAYICAHTQALPRPFKIIVSIGIKVHNEKARPVLALR